MPPSPPKRRKLDHDAGHKASENMPEQQSGHHNSDTTRHEHKAKTAGVLRSAVPESALYSGDILQLQVDELLNELAKTRKRRLAAANDHLRQLKATVESLPERQPVSPAEGERLLWTESKTAVPFPKTRPDKNAKYTVSYVRPLRVNVVGSFALDTTFVEKRTVPTIDLAVTIPATIFQDKDYLNHRYFVKRAFYLACLAAGLAANEQLGLSLQYEYQNDSLLQPSLVAVPTDEHLRSQYRIRIIVAAAADFADSKTLPDKNCIRSNTESVELASTPLYNATLRSECNVEPNLRFLHATGKANASFQQACVLVSVWLRQRGFGSSIHQGGFGPFESSVLIALLLHKDGGGQRALLSSGYSSFQLFKATLHFLASRDLILQPLFSHNAQNIPEQPQNEVPLIWDGTRGSNLCYKMSKASYEQLRLCAKTSLSAFTAPASDQLDMLFLRRCDHAEECFDDVFDIELTAKQSSQMGEAEGLSTIDVFSRKVFTTLIEGLGVRATSIQPRVLASSTTAWSLRFLQPPKQIEQLRVGLTLDAAHIHRSVDRGPPAEEKAAAAQFRNFWGERAELRRFQDSSILESVVWDEGENAAIVHRQVLEHVCARHLAQEPQYRAPDIFARDVPRDYASMSLSRMNALWRTYNELQTLIRDLERLPLQIRNFAPTAYIIDNVSSKDNRTDIMDIGLQFEGSARWPEDLVAIQRTKIAFLAKLQSLVQGGDSHFSCQLQQENASRPLLNCAFLEIASASLPHLFRIRIFHEREPSLLSDHLRKASSSLERTAFSEALSIFNRNFVRQPDHVQAMRRLSLRFPLLLPTNMLFKKWCSTHLLDPHLSSELQDLIVARIFTQPGPFPAPVSTGAAIIRVLKYLANWDWWNEPLIVDFGDMTAALLQEITTRFEAWRKIDPGLNRTVLFAASDLDVDGTTWTHKKPTRAVAARVNALATAAVARIDLHDIIKSFGEIFSTGTGDYDFLIHLTPDLRRHSGARSKQPVFKNLQGDSATKDRYGTAESASAMLIEELTNNLADSAVLFHNWATQSVPVIGGIWNPLEPRQWKTSLAYSTRPGASQKPSSESVEGAGLVDLNKPAILNDVARLGGDLILKIETREP